MIDYRIERDDGAVTHSEEAAYPSLAVVDLKRAAAAVDQPYRNLVVLTFNDQCMRLAVMEGEFRWHMHPGSDECFLALEGELEIDLADGRTFRLKPGEAFTLPAGVVHRTRSRGRAVNLCFEGRTAYVDAVFADPSAAAP